MKDTSKLRYTETHEWVELNGNVATVNTGAAAAMTWDGLHDLAFALPEQPLLS